MREEWTYKKIGEVASFINGDRGKNYPSQKDFVESGIPFINAGHLNDGNIDFDSMNYINDEKYDSLNSGKVKEGDILFCLRGSLGKKAIVKNVERGAIASSLVIIRSTSIFNQYLNYYLGSPTITRYIKRNNNGSSQPNLSAKSVSSFILPIPPLAEQKRIVEELDLLSSIIDKKKAQLKELDQLAQSIFYTMFGDPITNPKGWQVQALSTVCDVRDGTHDSPKYVDNGYPLITSKNVVNGTISFDNVNLISERDLIAINARSKVDDGDIIMPMIGTIGKPTIVIKTREFAIKNVALIKFSEAKRVLNIYIQKLLDSESYSRFIKEQNRGGTQKFISLGMIRKLPTPLPPLSLQQEFAEKVEAIEKQKALIQQSIAETQTLFDSRMDHWFS